MLFGICVFALAVASSGARLRSPHPDVLRTSSKSPLVAYPQEHYGYVGVSTKDESAMFYGIRAHPNSTIHDRTSQPLVLWLQGGPGGSSLFGDFLETGPVKVVEGKNGASYGLVPRIHTWTRHATMLYVDNPVGTGFSYSRTDAGFSTTDEDIAANLVTFLKGFYKRHPEFKRNDFWVMCESYGGKMTAFFGAALVQRASEFENLNFRGVALGDGWVDPVGCMKSYAPYLGANGLVNREQAGRLMSVAEDAAAAVQNGQGKKATEFWNEQQGIIQSATSQVNFYNIHYYYDYTAEDSFNAYMAKDFTTRLQRQFNVTPGIPFGSQSGKVFSKMNAAFMKDGISQVVTMLNAGIDVNVYTGQVDLIVDWLCTSGWVNKLSWVQLPSWQQAPRSPFGYNGKNPSGYVQEAHNLHVWSVNNAGHMVPLDQPFGAESMFAAILKSKVPVPPPSHSNADVTKIGVQRLHLPKVFRP